MSVRIAITGIGIVSALGVGKDENKHGLLHDRSGISEPVILRTSHREWPVGEVPLTNRQLKQKLELNPDSPDFRNLYLALLAADEAVRDAGLSPEQTKAASLVNGTTVGGMNVTEDFIAEWLDDNVREPSYLIQHEAHTTTMMISRFMGEMHSTTTVSTACSSALNAIITGANMLRTGEVERVLAGGTEALTRFHLNGFGSLGILSQNVCKPFQPDRDGINLGEGAAYLVLEKESDALARGAHIYGYVAGYANRCDAFHQTASSPEGEGAFLAMQEALQMAGLKPDDIQYLNAHGTATPNNDASESRAIERLFGTPFMAGTEADEEAVANRWPEPRSTKHLTGHTTSASGAIEAVFCLMLMKERGYRYVLTNAFGFGGNDSSLVLSSVAKELSEHQLVTPHVASFVQIDEDVDVRTYLAPLQARRLTPQMRRLVVAAKQALEQARIDKPDAIIVGTRFGGIKPTMTLLKSLVANGEQDFSPSLFMQSTHNTPASTLAILLGCHGYNTTFSVFCVSFEEAKEDAARLLSLDVVQSVLVCEYDEADEDWQRILSHAEMHNPAVAKATVLMKKKN